MSLSPYQVESPEQISIYLHNVLSGMGAALSLPYAFSAACPFCLVAGT